MENIIDKIKGTIYGQAIGDALGLGTEGMTEEEISQKYPNGITHYSDIYQDRHRRRWKIGDWTDDTDMMLCIANAVIKDKGVSLTTIAQNFKDWVMGEPMGIVFAPSLASDAASSEVIHSFFYSLVTEIVIASEGIVFIWRNLAEIIQKLLHLVDVAPEFITQRHHSERWMMTVFSEDVLAFLMQERHQPFILLIKRPPERKFRLEIDSQTVR